MAKMTLEELRNLRDAKKKEMTQRDSEDKAAQIIIGMGTCGIAAGANEAFLDELNSHNVKDTKITQTGCMGLCFSEPTVEVDVAGMPRVIYGNVDGKVARRIVKEHIIGKALVSDHIFDKPAADIIK